MNYKKKSIRDVDLSGKKIVLRVDFNLPLDKKTHAITNDKRVRAALPTIQYLLDQGAAVIACSHLGKPNATYEAFVKKQVAVALRSQGNWRWEGPLGTPLGLVHWKRASSPVEAGTAGYL